MNAVCYNEYCNAVIKPKEWPELHVIRHSYACPTGASYENKGMGMDIALNTGGAGSSSEKQRCVSKVPGNRLNNS